MTSLERMNRAWELYQADCSEKDLTDYYREAIDEAVLEEREACARLAEETCETDGQADTVMYAIRKRGESPTRAESPPHGAEVQE